MDIRKTKHQTSWQWRWRTSPGFVKPVLNYDRKSGLQQVSDDCALYGLFVRIAEVNTYRIRLPFHGDRSMHTAIGSYSSRLLLLVEIVPADSSLSHGWGECAALEDVSYFYENVDIAEATLNSKFIPAVLNAEYVNAAEVSRLLSFESRFLMAKAALEMAILDAELRASSMSLKQHLEIDQSRVLAGATVGFPSENVQSAIGNDRLNALRKIVRNVNHQVDLGFRRVKLKIAPGWDVDLVRVIRSEFPNLIIHVDANGSYEGAELGVLHELSDHGVSMIDQPLGVNNIDGHARLAKELSTPICLDESASSPTAVRQIVERNAAKIVCLKPGRLGGIHSTVRLQDFCMQNGVNNWIGGMYSSVLGNTVERVLASRHGAVMGDVTPIGYWFSENLSQEDSVDPASGTVAIPSEPGIGVQLSMDAIRQHLVGEPPLKS